MMKLKSRSYLTPSLCALGLLLCLLAPELAWASERAVALTGRWDVVFEFPDGAYETPIEFVVAERGSVRWTILGPTGTFRILATSGRLRGNDLTLEARTSSGNFKVKATLEGDHLRGRWSPSGFFAGLFFNGAVRGARDRRERSAATRAEIFDAAWEEINHRFYDPRFNGANWAAARERYRPLVAAARDDGEMATLIRQMLAELRSSHAEFFLPPTHGAALAARQNAAEPAISWRQLSSTTGYIKLARFDEDPQALAQVDRAFAELGHLPSLVIDLRGNGGGSHGLAMRVGDHLLAAAQPVGYFVSRAGLVSRGARSIEQINPAALARSDGYDAASFAAELARSGALMLVTGGRAPQVYRGRVAVLIDEGSYSAAEAFAGAVKETGAGVLVGRRTGGGMLGAEVAALPGGWMLVLPVTDFRTAGGARIEGRGVEPDVTVRRSRRGDAELARALEILRTARSGR